MSQANALLERCCGQECPRAGFVAVPRCAPNKLIGVHYIDFGWAIPYHRVYDKAQ
jgi:hypothetical protein